jgi:6-phosphofructokinase 1
MEILRGKLLIAQGGGPTAVINQSLAGAVIEARKYESVERIYGAVNGVNGIINEKMVDLTEETVHNLLGVSFTPAAALLSTRDKPDKEYCSRIFNVLKAHDIRYFFYIGGNDSSDTLRLVAEFAKDEDYEFRAVHIPKTVDNDLVLNDHTPGYPSAARFVAESFVGLDLDNRALPGVYIAVIMGRHAGFLTAASCMAQKYEDTGPHLIYLPERPFNAESFIDDVRGVYDKYGRCIVAVSEGIQDEEGTPVAARLQQNLERDAHGNIQLSGSGSLADSLKDLIKEKTGITRVRADTFGYLQRSFRACASEIDRIEAREVGEKAVHYGVGANLNGSVAIKRIGDYAVDYSLAKLEDIAGKTRMMPDKFINKSGNGVTKDFRSYLRPLLGSTFRGAGARLRAPAVKPILQKS